MGDELPDKHLTAPVVDGRVYEVDALVQHGVKQPSSVPVTDLCPVRLPQLHGAEAKGSDF